MQSIAIDLGAESGRVISGQLGDAGWQLDELHRFPTPVVAGEQGLRWDLTAIQAGIGEGMRRAAARGPIASIGVDTWGVDYGILDASGQLLTAPYCYRDPRTNGLPETFAKRYGAHAFFARSGVRPMVFNTVFQLTAHLHADPDLFRRAATILPISDVLHHWLSGIVARERTQVATWGMALPGATHWDETLLRDIGLDPALFGSITPTGTVLGSLRPELATAWGVGGPAQVVLPGGHDTASAVAGLDLATDDAYLSSGTWSLIGCVSAQPLLSEAFFAAGFSNEADTGSGVRLNRNIMGLWIVQECRRAFVAAGRTATYAELASAAESLAPSPRPLDVDDQRFFAPAAVAGPMPERIAAWCREQGIGAPTSDAAYIRLALDGLATAYALALRNVSALSGRRFKRLVIGGGGVNNRLLNTLTAQACGLPVSEGPTEATAIGNLRVQAAASRPALQVARAPAPTTTR